MTALLQETASGFNRSANRRIDAELCLLRLCDERLDTDPRSILARLSKLEAQVESGVRIAPVLHQRLAVDLAAAGGRLVHHERARQ